MFALVKQAICLDGKDYSRGVHEFPEKFVRHEDQALFHKFLEHGLIVKQDKAPEPIESLAERGERLAQKFAAPVEPTPEVVEEPVKKKSKQK